MKRKGEKSEWSEETLDHQKHVRKRRGTHDGETVAMSFVRDTKAQSQNKAESEWEVERETTEEAILCIYIYLRVWNEIVAQRETERERVYSCSGTQSRLLTYASVPVKRNR
jgi:hypothetical protein